MPTVNDLGAKRKGGTATPSTPAKSTSAPSTTTPPVPSAQGNLIQSTPGPVDQKALTKAASGINLPAYLQDDNKLPEVAELTGYIGFASNASEKFGEMQAIGLTDGEPFLHHNGSYVKLPVPKLEFFVLMGEEFQTIMVGKKGEFRYATRDMEEEHPGIQIGGNIAKLEKHYITLCLVKLGDTLVPIKGDFRGTKSGGLETALRAIKAASDPEWATRSPANRVACAFPKPFGRVFHGITTSRHISMGNGNPYYRANCQSRPSNESEIMLLVNSFNDEDFLLQLNEAKKNYDSRVKIMDDLATNGYQPRQQG